MALKRLEGPSRKLLQQCSVKPTRRAFFTSATAKPAAIVRIAHSVTSTVKSHECLPTRPFTSCATRQAASQEPPNTKSYLASGAFASESSKLVDVKKVLVIGSGGLSIGQAGEFDYSGKLGTRCSNQDVTNIGATRMMANICILIFRLTSVESTKRGGCYCCPHKS